MSDDNSDDSLFDRLRGRVSDALAPDDGSASPQARDTDPVAIGREEFREEVDARDIETFTTEYFRNPLIRVPIQNFASDVTEPGVSVTLDGLGDDDPPEVVYEGETTPLDDALEDWVNSSYIDGFSFSSAGADLLEEVVKDRRGRRGTAMVELAYDDPRDRNDLLGLKLMRPETTVTYTREGKAIPLRPDDAPGTFDTVALDDLGDESRDEPPSTPAGKTASVVQFDDTFGVEEKDEVPFSLDDLVVSAHDADTGELYGRPDTASVVNRARSLRKKLRYVDQSVINTAFGNIIATVESQNEEVVKEVKNNLTPNVRDRGEEDLDPETVSTTNAPVEVYEVEGNVPDVQDVIQQEIEFILSAMPTPLYRVGFAGDINRDVTSEQSEDYRDSVKRERRRLEADFQDVLEQKARDLLLGDPKADDDLAVTPRLRVRPADAESPLRDEEFDASEFSTLMSGLSTAAGPKGGATALIPEETIVETFLDMDSDILDGSGDSPPPAGLESDAAREAFERLQDDATLATRYESGDAVSTPDGPGVVVEAAETTIEVDGETVDGSERSPAYVVALDSGGASTFRASELNADDWFPDDDVDPSTLDQAERAAVDPLRFPSVHADRDRDTAGDRLEDPGVGFDRLPDGWDRSSVLKAWSSLGGSFTSARREFQGEVRDPAGLAAALKDEVLGFETWRGGFAAAPAADTETDLAENDPDGPFADVPVLPDNLDNLSEAWLIRYAEYVAAGKPTIAEEDRLAPLTHDDLQRKLANLEFVPELHPRDPETGQFVERPFDLPDDAPDFVDMSTRERLEYLDENDDAGVIGDTLFNPDESITADGVPNNATSIDDVPEGDDLPADPDPAEADSPIPDLPDGIEGFGEVDQATIDPGWSEAKVDEFRDAVERGDIDLSGKLNHDGPLGVDRGVAALTVDLLDAGNPTEFSNFASYGTYRSSQPHLKLEKFSPEFTSDAADRITERLPEGYEAFTTDDGRMIRVDLAGRDTLTNRMGDLQADADEEFPNAARPADAVEQYLQANDVDVVDEYDLPSNETRAELDRAMATGVRDALDATDGDIDILTSAERRSDFDSIETGEEIETLDDVEVGDKVVRTFSGTDTLYEVTGLEDESDNQFSVREATIEAERVSDGRERSFSLRSDKDSGLSTTESDIDDIPEPDVSIDPSLGWSESGLTGRKEAVEDALEKWTPFGDRDNVFEEAPLPDDGADEWVSQNKESIARGLAAAKDAEVAETAIARLGQVGDQGGGSHAGTNTLGDQPRGYMKLFSQSDRTAVHETGHTIFQVQGFKGGVGTSALDYNFEFPDRPDIRDDFDRFTITDSDSPGLDTDDSLGRDEFKDRVEAEVGEVLDGRNFSKPPDSDLGNDYSAWAEDAEPGDMVRFEEDAFAPAADGEDRRTFRVVDKRDAEDAINETDAELFTTALTVESATGEQFEFVVRDEINTTRAVDYAEMGTTPPLAGKRESTPDGWGVTNPDPDDALDEDPADTPEDKLRRVAQRANAAFYKQNLLHQQYGDSVAEESMLRTEYSSMTTQETLAQLHGSIQTPNVSVDDKRQTAKALVRHHPRLLAAYRDAFDIPDDVREFINDELERRNAETRL